MLEDAILAAKAGEIGLERDSTKGLSPQITVDAPIMIPEEYVPDLAVRMALYRRLNDAEDGARSSPVRRDDRPLWAAAQPTRTLSSLSRSSVRPSRRISPRSTWGARHSGRVPQ
jgi:transcription-repair coupling factor (superfamily II helicase)